MASLQKVQDFDLKNLRKFKKSLVCKGCRSPPRPNGKIYHLCSKCQGLYAPIGGPIFFTCEFCLCCKYCNFKKRTIDHGLKAFVSSFKLYNCLYLNNGCEKELEAKSLEAHERICLFRDVTCPKLDCKAKFAFNEILDHYQSVHSDAKTLSNVLEFKGNLGDLKKNNFVLNCYGMPFYPQFYVRENLLHCHIIGHGDKAEINSFKASMKVFIEERSLLFQDFVKSIDIDKNLLTFGQDGMTIPVKTLTEYYDTQSNQFKNQEFIEFEMKITSEKLDEIAKDENTESGVEDSGSEEK